MKKLIPCTVWDYFTVFFTTSAWLKANNGTISFIYIFLTRVAILSVNKQFYSITVKWLLPLLVLVLLIQIVVPAIGIHYLKNWYSEQGNDHELSIGSWSFVPWRGVVSLGDVVFSHDGEVSNIHKLHVNIGVLDLLDHKITVESLLFDGLELTIKKYAEDTHIVGLSINSMTKSSDQTSQNEPINPVDEDHSWAFEIKKIDIKNHKLGWLQPNLNMKWVINNINLINPSNSKGLILGAELTLHELSIPDQGVNISKPFRILLNGEITHIVEQPEFKGKLELGALQVQTQLVSAIGFERLTLSDLNLSVTKQTVGLFELEGLVIGETLLALNRYAIDNIQLDDSQLTTGLHEFSGLNSVIELTTENTIKGLVVESDANEVVAVQSDQASVKIREENEHAIFKIDIENIKQADNDQGRIRLINRSVDPEMDITFTIKDLLITNINNHESPLGLYLLANTDEYSQVKFEATTNLLEQPSGEIKLEVNQFNLIALSGYVEKAIGYHVNQGQLNYTMNVIVDEGKLAGEGKLKINNSLMTPSDKSRMDQISKQISMPIETVLSLIKDDNNNIEMSVPIKGNMNAPDFGLDDLISKVGQKALMAASLHYIKQAIFPYGLLVNVADYVGSELFSITLTPIVYEENELTQDQLNYLKKILAMMQDKDNLQLHVCAQVDQTIKLEDNWYAVALEKANKIKRVMVEADKDMSGRIVVCQPKLADKTQVLMGF